MIIVVRLSSLAKNVPHRNRAGLQFVHTPHAAEVTEEQFDAIKNDPYLKVCNYPSVAWFEGLGIEHTSVNEEKYKGKTIDKMPKTARLAASIAPASSGTQPQVSAQPGASGDESEGNKKDAKDNKPAVLSASSSIEELVKALEAKGKVAGKDFQTNAKASALFGYLSTL